MAVAATSKGRGHVVNDDPILACHEALTMFGGAVENFEWHPRGFPAKIDWHVKTTRGPRLCGLRASRRKATQEVHTSEGTREDEVRFLVVATRVYNVPWDAAHAKAERTFISPSPIARPVRIERDVWQVRAYPRCAPYAAWDGAAAAAPPQMTYEIVAAIQRTAAAAVLLVIPDAVSVDWGSGPNKGTPSTRDNPERPW